MIVSQTLSERILLSVGSTGLLAGVSLNKTLVELPAGTKIGPRVFSRFSRAADLGNGRVLYPLLGLLSPVLVFAGAALVFVSPPSSAEIAYLITVALVLSAAHVVTTAGAAPNMFRIGKLGEDVAALERAYRVFQRWTMARTILRAATFSVLLSVLGVILGGL